jgi:hypothetical protein
MATDKDVMSLVQSGGKKKTPDQVKKARQQLIDYMSHYKVTADSINKMGQLGMIVLKNKTLYPMFVEQARKMQIPGADKLSPQPDFRQIGSIVGLSKLLES